MNALRRSSAPARHLWSLTALAAAAALAGCATPPAATPAATPPAAAASGVPPSGPKPDPAAPKPFADVSKDAKRTDGFIPLWRKDDKVWLELAEDRINKPMLLTIGVRESVGERGLYASQMSRDWLVEWRRVGNTIQLIAKNTDYRPGADLASRLAVQQAFSDSLLASSGVASAPHPERKSILVDASMLLVDLPGYSTNLEMAFRMPFTLDRANSSFDGARASERMTSLNTRLHFAVPRLSAPPLTPPPVPQPPPPKTTPDPRSLFVALALNFTQLPEPAMQPRLADPRVGHFTESYTDFATDTKANQRVHYVSRWRLEKKDPAAALSEPVQPITYWLDRNIPERYRASVTAGILEWNKAFEKIGYKNAVVAKQQPDDADFDTLDTQHASIRWFVGADVGFAIGPSKRDPRTGEIIDADIGMSDVFTRGARRMVAEDLGMSEAAEPHAHGGVMNCSYGREAAAQMHMAMDLLEARGEMAPDGPEAEAYVQAVVRDVIAHEVGHTLGLKHNFKASTTITAAQLADKAWTDANGISASVMDYNATNLPLKGEAPRSLTNTAIGAYDYWAIEYAYRPLAPEAEGAELQRIAARSVEPLLAFADDADADGPAGIDPTVNRFDLGPDPLAWYGRRMALSKELWQRVQARGVQQGDDPLRARRVIASGFRQLRDMPELVSKYVGGMSIVRDSSYSGRPAYQPVAPARQREALTFLQRSLFSPESFSFRPEFLTHTGTDSLEWERAGPVNIGTVVLQLQTRALDRLMAAGTAQRVLELPGYLTPAERKGTFSLDELYGTLQGAVWAEAARGGAIDPLRRNLQREHLARMQSALLSSGKTMPADAVSLLRWHAVKLQSQLRSAVQRGNADVTTRAHLQESLDRLTQTLNASMQRS